MLNTSFVLLSVEYLHSWPILEWVCKGMNDQNFFPPSPRNRSVSSEISVALYPLQSLLSPRSLPTVPLSLSNDFNWRIYHKIMNKR